MENLEQNGNKKQILSKIFKYTITAIVFIIITICIVAEYRKDSQRDDSLTEKIFDLELGETYEHVISRIGKPYAESNDAIEYFRENTRNPEKTIYFRILFTDGKITEILCDTQYDTSISEKDTKKIMNYTVQQPYIAFDNNSCEIIYSSVYRDMSFYKGRAIAESTVEDREYSLKPVEVKWYDLWGCEYIENASVLEEDNIFYGTNCYVEKNSLNILKNNYHLESYDVQNSQPIYNFNISSNLTNITLDNQYIKDSTQDILINYEGSLTDWCNIEYKTISNLYDLYLQGELLREISTTEGISTIKDNAFANCKSLTRININGNTSVINQNAFKNCINLSQANLKSNISLIEKSIFEGCISLKELTLPFVGEKSDCSGNTFFAYIFGAENYAHSDDYVPRSLEKIAILGGQLSPYAFANCTNVLQIYLPNTADTIPEYSFAGCKRLRYIDIPEGVNTIDNAFGGCYSLISLTIPSSVTKILNKPFLLPIKLIEIVNKSATNIRIYDTRAKNICTDTDGSKIIKSNDFVFYNDENNYICMGYEGTEENIVMPEYIDGQSYEINKYAFAYNNIIKSIILSDNISKIGDNSFEGCTQLQKIKLNDNLQYIGFSAFENCSALTSLKIPQNISSLESRTFYNCLSLEYIIIPTSLTVIYNGVFTNCNNLKKIFYENNAENFKKIYIAPSDFSGTNEQFINATKYYYYLSESDITEDLWKYNDNGEVQIIS